VTHDRLVIEPAGVVVALGAVAVDELLYVDAELSEGKGRIINRERLYGGNAATALAAVAVLGGQARYAGMLPDRDQWADVHADLAGWGIVTGDATVVDGGHPVRSTIVVTPSGERFIAFDDSGAIGPSAQLDLDAIISADALLVDGYQPAAALRAIGAAQSAGVPTIGDFERLLGPEAAAVTAAVDHLVVPLNFARQITATHHPHAVVEALWNDTRAAVVVTDGGNGLWFCERQNRQISHIAAYEVAVVDTTGCGDIFHGAYALGIARGHDVAASLTFASAAAALGATARGGRGHLPAPSEVTTLIASGSRRPTTTFTATR
jgi:sugar/nucleoside kinase (ribokinase family)